MNQEVVLFKSQYILEEIEKIDSKFTYNIIDDFDNDITGIVWMTSYTRDNFDRFGNYLSIDIMRSFVCNAKKWKINVVCEVFLISETHDVYSFILESLFKISTSRSN